MEKVKPTRIELLNLRNKLKKSQRGHKLLKEKRDGLMSNFMGIVREAKEKRKEMEEKLASAGKDFALASAGFSQKEIEQFFLDPSSEVKVKINQKNIMGVKIPLFECEVKKKQENYSYFSFPIRMEQSLKKFQGLLSLMLELASIEHAARLLSFEIEKTRRRVNALEYIVIPQVEKNIKYISSKLDEDERFDKIVRMKVKDMIA